jgi:hypothetical protein
MRVDARHSTRARPVAAYGAEWPLESYCLETPFEPPGRVNNVTLAGLGFITATREKGLNTASCFSYTAAIKGRSFAVVARTAMAIDSSVELQTTPHDDSHEEPSRAAQPDQTYPTGARFMLLTLGIVFTIFLSALDTSIISTAIPKITDEFGTVKDVAWYGSAYTITNAAFQSTWGKAYKYFPLKRVFLLTVFIFELGNTICAAAPNSSVLILGRIIAGMGGGGMSSRRPRQSTKLSHYLSFPLGLLTADQEP